MTKYELVAILVASASLLITLFRWALDRKLNKRERVEKFYEQLINGFYTHNWKFMEHWDNEGIRPQLDSTIDVEKDKKDFGRRVVLLDHLNILRQIHLHRKILSKEEIEGFTSWANSWFDRSKDQLEIVFKDGDLFPTDYVIWLRDKIFGKDKFETLMGQSLIDRIQGSKE
jgi:hypothetical protein